MFRVISILNVARFSSSRLTYSTDHIETHAKFYESHNRTESEINRLANVHIHIYYIYNYIYMYVHMQLHVCMYVCV